MINEINIVMSLFGCTMFAIFLIWSFFSTVVIIFIKDYYEFFRSIGFAILCIGYVAIFAVYHFFKKISRSSY